jgi:hypothetical protein
VPSGVAGTAGSGGKWWQRGGGDGADRWGPHVSNNEERMRHGAEGAIRRRKPIQLKAAWVHGRTELAGQIGGLG